MSVGTLLRVPVEQHTVMISKNRLRYLSSLLQKKQRQAQGKFLIEGIRLCEEAVDSTFVVEAIFYCPALLSGDRGWALIEKSQARGIETVEIDTQELRKITDTVHSQGMVGQIRTRKFQFDEIPVGEKTLILALDRISDPGNSGTLLRTADWFGVSAVLLSQDSVEVYNPKVLRATMGAIFHLPILEEINLKEAVTRLKGMGFGIYAADINGTYFHDQIEFFSKKVLLVGNEASGIHPDLLNSADFTIRIHRWGRAESLNVAVATGIILSQMVKYQRRR